MIADTPTAATPAATASAARRPSRRRGELLVVITDFLSLVFFRCGAYVVGGRCFWSQVHHQVRAAGAGHTGVDDVTAVALGGSENGVVVVGGAVQNP